MSPPAPTRQRPIHLSGTFDQQTSKTGTYASIACCHDLLQAETWTPKLRLRTYCCDLSSIPGTVRPQPKRKQKTQKTRLSCHATKAKASLAAHLIARLAHKVHHDVLVRSRSSPWQRSCLVKSPESCGQGWSRTEMRRNLTFSIPVHHILPYLKSDRTVIDSSASPACPPFISFLFPPGY